MKKKNKFWLILSILVTIISAIAIVVFEASNEPVFNSDAEKIVLIETEIESERVQDYPYGYVYKVRIDCDIENISNDSLLVKMYYTVKTVDGSETYEIESPNAKVMEANTEYNAWAEFSHPTKNYGVLEKVSVSVNGGEVTELLPKKDMPMTTGAMVSAVFFIAGVVGIVMFAKKGKFPIGEISEEEYNEHFGGGFDPDRDYDDDDDDDDHDHDSEEIRALREEIEKEKLQSTLTEMRSKKPKHCEYCGAKNKGGETQCSNCGARLK